MKKLSEMISDRNVAICKIGKFQEDFQYVFDWVHPTCYIDDSYSEKTYNELPVHRVSELGEAPSPLFIIICDLEAHNADVKGREWQCFGELGLEWGKDYVFADELFSELDFDYRTKIRGRKIAYWGTGNPARQLLLSGLPSKYDLEPALFINGTAKSGDTINGIKVVSPKEIKETVRDYYVIVLPTYYYYEIQQNLREMGAEEYEDFAPSEFVFDLTHKKPSEMMRKTVYDKPLCKQPFCRYPFDELFLHSDGATFLCWCNDFIKMQYAQIGNWYAQPFESLWTSNAAKIFRLAILNNTFSFCDEHMCESMVPYREEDVLARRKQAPQATDKPSTLFVSIDGTCNLKCPSCRTHSVVYTERFRKNREAMIERLHASGLLDSLDNLYMAGIGEVFFNQTYRSILYHDGAKKRKSISLISNGTLFTEEEFQHLKDNYEEIRTIRISVDGMTEATLKKLRPGLHFDTFVANLRNLGLHRQRGEIEKFILQCVVQMDNLYELKDIVRFGQEIHADEVLLMHMNNRVGYADAEFEAMSVETFEGDLKPEAAEILSDPIFDAEIVSMPWFKSRLNGENV